MKTKAPKIRSTQIQFPLDTYPKDRITSDANNSEPQNIKQGMSNLECFTSAVRNSLFDILNFKYFGLAFACFVVFVVGYLFLLQPLPGSASFEQVRAAHLRSDGLLFDRHGEVIHELRTDERGRRLDWIRLKDISPALQSSIIAEEDHRFFRHGGVDWIALGAASLSAFDSSRLRGASTITMQLTALLNEDLQPGKTRRSVYQKARQIRAARSYEKSWSKAQILEAYLNLVTFRGELQGIAAAARGLFGKEPQGLNDAEGVILSALVRSPNAGIEPVLNRARTLAQSMKLSLAPEEVEAAARNSLARPYFVRPQVALAPHVALRLFGETKTLSVNNAPARLSCTLDGRLQSFTAEALRHHVLSARLQNMHDGAALVVDNRSGEVLAYVGNIGDQSSARFVDGIQAARQAGSTLKPFVYALAFEKRLITPVSLIEDSPLDVPVLGGVYRPKNYDNIFHGAVTARVALASSLNVPAVKTLNLIGVEPFVDRLRLLGFSGLESPEFYGPSLALGSADVTLWNLVNAYRTLANGGMWSPLRLIHEGVETPQRVLSDESAFLIADILSDRESRSRTFALESPLSTRFWTAVKTGTSKDMRDNWCVGFSDQFTVGIWAGNFSGLPMWDVSGVTGAAPVWVEVMNWLHRNQSSHPPLPPAGLVQKTVKIPSIAQERKDWFIAGTDTMLVEPAAGRALSRIVYPANGTIVALDPDIPVNAQKMFFETSATTGNLEWFLDGQSIGQAAALTPWAPQRGKHVLKLMEKNHGELDSIDFEVRGN
jgi:penicillin-binding protein 1C